MDIEKFPESEAALRMMSYITGNGFYDQSWVGKWIFEVMGREWDSAGVIVDELPEQAFVETATWGLMYHEQKYSLPVRDNLSDDERRLLIRQKRDLKAPMSPWRMENILEGYTGCKVSVLDIYESPADLPHPNVYEVQIANDAEIDIALAMKKLRSLTQSHVTYIFNVICEVGIQIKPQSASYKSVFDLCGTLPDTSTGLSMHGTGIEIEGKSEGYATEFCMSGEIDTGTEPMESTGLGSSSEMLDIGISAESYGAQYRICGEEFYMEE